MEKSVELKAELLGIFSLLNYIAYGQKIMSKIEGRLDVVFAMLNTSLFKINGFTVVYKRVLCSKL